VILPSGLPSSGPPVCRSFCLPLSGPRSRVRKSMSPPCFIFPATLIRFFRALPQPPHGVGRCFFPRTPLDTTYRPHHPPSDRSSARSKARKWHPSNLTIPANSVQGFFPSAVPHPAHHLCLLGYYIRRDSTISASRVLTRFRTLSCSWARSLLLPPCKRFGSKRDRHAYDRLFSSLPSSLFFS